MLTTSRNERVHFKVFFFQRCPLEQIVLKVKLFDIGPPKAVLRLALQPPDPDDIERTVLLLKQVKRKKNLKCCHVTDLGAEPLFCLFMSKEEKNGHQSLNVLD